MSSESTIVCPQKTSWYDPWEVVGDEDCLFLNVYSPDNHQQVPLDSNSIGVSLQSDDETSRLVQVPLPVMVWIHGGALLAGSGTFQEHGPQHLLDK